MSENVRKRAAVVAILALLLPCISALAGTLAAADLPPCCDTGYCPVHHRQPKDLQKDKSHCDSSGMPGHNDCSMRACDAAPNPAVGSAVFVLVTPVALRGLAVVMATIIPVTQFAPFVTATPITPPPRTSLS